MQTKSSRFHSWRSVSTLLKSHTLLLCSLALILPAMPSRSWATQVITTTTLEGSSGGGAATTVEQGTAVTLTATVKAGTAKVTVGRVNFCDAAAAHCTDIHLLGIEQLTSAGTAVHKFVPGPGSHSYKAVFVGTNSNAASSSAVSSLDVTPLVGKDATTTAIAQSDGASPFTLTATVVGDVSSATAAAPTGTVSFLDTSNADHVLGAPALGAGKLALSWTTSSSLGAGWQPENPAVADFNGDGYLDLAVPDAYGGLVTVLLGRGDGTFTTAAITPTTTSGTAIATGDFNGDGKPDLAMVNASNDVEVFLGAGDGTFGAPWIYSGAATTSLSSIVVGDFNGDGKADLAVADRGTKDVIVLLGKGDGTFTPETARPATGKDPVTMVTGDFNGDGKADLAVLNSSDNSVTVLLGNGDGTFMPTAVSPATGYGPNSIVVADFNGDGKADLAVSNGYNPAGVTILLGNGNGTFQTSKMLVFVSTLQLMAVGDFNGDGNADLAYTNFYTNSVTVLLGNGNGTFVQGASPPFDLFYPSSIGVGDFNGDGKSDLAVAFYHAYTADIYLAQFTQTATASVGGITLTGAHKVEARYAGDAHFASSVSGLITVPPPPAATPVFKPVQGTYTTKQSVTITDGTKNAVIRYTTNGSTPTSASAVYNSAITVSATDTIKAIAIEPGYAESAVAQAKYTITPPAATPKFSPLGGTYATAQTVKITSTTANATIYYTTNGMTPTTASTKYTTAGVKVSASEKIEAIAVATGFSRSAVASATYTIQ